jgi:hypothetical protein
MKMSFNRAQYLQAMRDQSPELMKELRQSGQMAKHLADKAKEHDASEKEALASVDPQDENLARMIREQVQAETFDFPIQR